MFYFSKKVRLFSQNDVLFLFYFLVNPTMTTEYILSEVSQYDNRINIMCSNTMTPLKYTTDERSYVICCSTLLTPDGLCYLVQQPYLDST